MVKQAKTGRPVGSTSGRLPPGGFPAVHRDLGPFLSGFIEGEGCFLITKQSRGTNHGCSMTLASRADDEALIRCLIRATGVGSLGRKAAHGTSKPQVVWAVCAKSDCARLVEILDAYPLRGRKSWDYAIWRAAVRWWIAGDPTRTVRSRDWAPMIYLKERLSECKAYVPPSDMSLHDGPPILTDEWLAYLSGFTTAEGHLGISVNSQGGCCPRFQIGLRADDLPLLCELRERVDAGRIYESPREPRRGPYAAWMVRDAPGLMRLMRNLDRYPPRGRKRREYEIWRQAVLEYAKPGPRKPIHKRLGELRTELAEARAYLPGRST
jgi:hypothetical protein